MTNPFANESRSLTDTCLAALRSDYPLSSLYRPVTWRRALVSDFATFCAVFHAAKYTGALFAVGTLTGTVLGALAILAMLALLPPVALAMLTEPDALIARIDGEVVPSSTLQDARRNLLHHKMLIGALVASLLLLGVCAMLAAVGT